MGDYMPSYYDGTKLLSMLDLDGNKPEIYMCTTNRSGGKTTYFSRLLVNKFLNENRKFMLIYRYNYQLDDCADKFFKDIGTLFFTGKVMKSKRRANGLYHELFLDDKSCGYAVSLNSAGELKNYSHLFSDTAAMMFDEFQSESNHYCDKEVDKFRSIHMSVARGQHKQVRYVPVYMLSNPVTILNPYYVAMGISDRLTDKVKYLRGSGFVLEQGFVESASRAQQESGFNKAFGNDSYNAYASQGVYLNDNKSFIEKPNGSGKYIATLRYNGCDYGVREYADIGVVYCDNRADVTFPVRLAVTTEDHQINYIMLRNNLNFVVYLRYLFDRGCFRFKDLRSKEAILHAISY